MARSDLRLRLGTLVVTVLSLTRLPAADPPEPPPQAIANTLATQDAMRQGRELLRQGKNKDAIDALEAQLPRINGNTAYLGLLREAYYAYLKELQLADRRQDCEEYLKRLRIIDKTAKLEDLAAPPHYGRADAKAPPVDKVVRAVRGEDDPLQQTPLQQRHAAQELLAKAEKAFAEQHYADAGRLFAEAAERDPALPPPLRGQWAYCKLACVVAKLRQTENQPNGPALPELEQEVRVALSLAPKDGKLDAFGQKIIDEIHKRRGTPAPQVEVRHGERGADGWDRAETANFRLLHHQPRESAEQVLRVAEQARAKAFEKWGGQAAGPWKPACEIYLHAKAADYAQATGQPVASPGHSTLKTQGKAIVSRRIDLHADEVNLLGCVLPHETTHVVLGDLFAGVSLPRWADEGMAVLAESPGQVERYLRTLRTRRQQGQLVPLTQLLGQAEYPDAATITVFYVESVSVVEFLAAEHGPVTFTRFVRDLPNGIEAALQRHYGIETVDRLEKRWLSALLDRGVIGMNR
jgi:tetratricopeptide (TPR) repeat protein